VRGKLSLFNEDISPQVSDLLSMIWGETLDAAYYSLKTDTKYMQERQVTHRAR